METIQWAKYYVEKKGYSVIPVGANKKPTIEEWKPYQTRRPTEKELQQWFGNGSKNNIGIVTGAISGIAVVDFDTPEAVKFAKEKAFPSTPLVKTGKGYHAYCRYKPGIGNFQDRDDLPGIDLRAEGGFVVAPPSIHESGRQYEWAKNRGIDDLPLADIPAWILAEKPEDKTPLKDLYAGVSKGDRNQTLARLAGSWINDNLTFEECLENASLWNQKNNPPLPENEVKHTVKSIFERHHSKAVVKPVPAWRPGEQSKSHGLIFTPVGDLLREPEESVNWLVDRRLPSAGLSVLAGKPKAGKSTLARNLAKSTAKGTEWLGFPVQQGTVFYLGLEEKKSEVKRHFTEMGVSPDDPIFVFIAPSPQDGLAQLYEAAKEKKPVLIIIDPLLKFVRLRDANDYAAVTLALEPLLTLARETGAHVLTVHHLGKGERSGGDAILGSTAIFAAVDSALLLKRTDRYRTLSSIQRYGEDLEEITLSMDDTGRITAGPSRRDAEESGMAETILEYLKGQDEPVEEKTIIQEIEGRRAIKVKALRTLVSQEKVIRAGRGGKGDPFKYSCSRVPTIYRKQENKNPENTLISSNGVEFSCSRENKNFDSCSHDNPPVLEGD